MAILKSITSMTIGQLMKKSSKVMWKHKAKLADSALMGGTAGISVGIAQGQAGHKMDAAKHGAAYGAIGSAMGTVAALGSRIVFRKIRGRIIPMRMKS